MDRGGCRAPAASWVSGVRRLLLLAVNLSATTLTLLTGLRENPVVLFATGKYEYARTRFIDGDVNYDNMRYDTLRQDAMINLTDVGNNYRFIQGPLRNPASVNADRSICMRVNTMNVSLMIGRYDDFWGTGTRRLTRYTYSISAPSCDVINLQSDWVDSCSATHGNMLACHRYILDNFDALREDMHAQTLTAMENGLKGVPYLRCTGRPEEAFEFQTDWMLQHAYWSGGSYHVELQTSDCLAIPAGRTADWKHGLFQVKAADDASSFMVAVHGGGWVSEVVSVVYGVVTIVLIASGIVSAIVRSSTVLYIPNKTRFVKEYRVLRWVFPFMSAAIATAEDENTIIRLKGGVVSASNLWVNHWLYISVSILDAIVNIRKAYVIYGYGTWYLVKKITFENFIFTCGALTRMAWFMCFVHTLQRLGLRVLLRSMRKFRVIKPAWRHNMEWYVDSVALFMSYRLYSVILCVLLYSLLMLRGSVTFMVKMAPFKVPTYGGLQKSVRFMGSELMCDYVVITSLLTVLGWTFGSIMLLTKYRVVANNSVVRLLQRRYVFVGWDAFVAFEALGIDPFQPSGVVEDSAPASCSLGTLVQQMYLSGPSGLVTFAGDYMFERGGLTREPVTYTFQTKRAVRMRMLESMHDKTTRGKVFDISVERAVNEARAAQSAPRKESRRDLFERRLQLFGESTYGMVLLVDSSNPGQYRKNTEGFMEFAVRDALSFMTIHDVEHVLGNEIHLSIS
jgi:hypothetical protein